MYNIRKHEKKVTRKSISLETKMQVIRRLDSGERQSQISASMNMATSTIRTILRNKEKILLSATSTTSSSATRITRTRNNTIEEMERQLSIWIDDKMKHDVLLSQKIIMEKARNIFNSIQSETSDIKDTFVASRGWFDRFKIRYNLNNKKITGEAASCDAKAADEFSTTFETIIEQGNYPLELILSVDENVEQIVDLAKQTGLGKSNVENIEETIQELSDSLSTDDLQLINKREENIKIGSDFNDVQKELSMVFVDRSVTTVTEIMDQFIENDPNFERSSKARRGVIDALSAYQQLLKESRRKTQPTLEAFLIKRPKIKNTV